MTKYILHGGNSKDVNPDNDSFFREMTLGLSGKVLVLLNYFSREDEEIDTLVEQDKQRFLQNSDNKDLSFEVANVDTLSEQIQRTDVMYMRGGETQKLVDKMKTVGYIEKLFANKVIGGSSAGVYVLAKYYWENDNGKIGDGLGIFDFKAYCHYEPQDKDIVQKLLDYKEEKPLLVLPNFKWQIFYKK